MVRAIKYCLFLLCFLGCGSETTGNASEWAWARSACLQVMTEFQYQGLVSVFEAGRIDGYTRSQSVSSALNGCAQWPSDRAECNTCVALVGDAVY